MTNGELLRRYGWLLRAYPKAYRAERGDEILATVAELARPGQRVPSVREAWALLLGGLRIRAGVHSGQSVGRGALRLAVLLQLAYATALMVGYLDPVYLPDWGYFVTAVLAAAALVAVAAGRPGIGLGLILAAMVTQHWAPNQMGFAPGLLWPLPLAALLLLPLLRRPPPASAHPWRWLLAIPVMLLVMPTQFPVLFHAYWPMWKFGGLSTVELVLLAACLLWTVVDVRVSIAVGVLMLPSVAAAVQLCVTFRGVAGFNYWYYMPFLALAILPLVAGLARAPRQARA